MIHAVNEASGNGLQLMNSGTHHPSAPDDSEPLKGQWPECPRGTGESHGGFCLENSEVKRLSRGPFPEFVPRVSWKLTIVFHSWTLFMVQWLVWLAKVHWKDWVLGTVCCSFSVFCRITHSWVGQLSNYIEKHLQLLIYFLQMQLQHLNIPFLLPLFLLCLCSVLRRHLDATYGHWAAGRIFSSSVSCWYAEVSKS